MKLTSEEINALEQSREKETQIRKVLKDLVYNKRIKLNEKKVASVRKGREFSKLDYRYAVSLLDDKEIEKQKNYPILASLSVEKLPFSEEKEVMSSLRRKKLLERKTKSPRRENAFRLRIAPRPFVDAEDDPLGYLERYLLLRSNYYLIRKAEEELKSMGTTSPKKEQIEREADSLFSNLK